MKSRLSLFLFAVAVMFFAHTADATTGFIEKPLWLTPESPKEGEMATLAVVFGNAEASTISGLVVFYDGDTILGRKPITVSSGSVGTASVAFRVGAGDHKFSASMQSLERVTKNGTKEPYALPVESTSLPKQFVGKASVLSAQAVNVDLKTKSTSSVDLANESVLSHIPDSLELKITTTSETVEGWRDEQATKYEERRDELKSSIEPKEKDQATVVKGTSEEESAEKLGPLGYVKYGLFTLFAFILGSRVIFYLICILVAFYILRFIWRKIWDLTHRNKH